MSKKGLPFIGKLNDFIEKVLHPTVQRVGHSRAALDVIGRGYYLLNSGAVYTAEAGSNSNSVKVTAHGFKPGDLVRLASTSNSINEFEIIIDSITDADNFILAGYLSANLTAGDTFYVLRPIAEQFSATGASMTTLSASPVQYNRKIGGTTTATNVLEDIDTPTNSRALPVVIHGLDAAVVTVTANEINVRSDSTNDSIALGNTAGTFYADITAANALKVDGSAVTQPVSGTFWQATQPVSDTATASINGKIPSNLTVTATRLLVDGSGVTQPVSGTVTVNALTNSSVVKAQLQDNAGTAIVLGQTTKSASLPVTLASDQGNVPISGTVTANLGTISGIALDTNVDALRVLTGAVNESAPGTDTANSGLNGRLQRIAQRLSSLIALVPASLGAQTGANSFSVVPASDAKFSVKPSAITTTYAENLALTTVTTITAPANAVSVLVQADDTNANNIRVKQNATASLTSGFQLQAGRDIVFDGGQDLSVISDNNGSAGASVKIYFSWKVQA